MGERGERKREEGEAEEVEVEEVERKRTRAQQTNGKRKKRSNSFSQPLFSFSSNLPHLRDVDRMLAQGRVAQRVGLEPAREGLGDGLEREREQLEDKGRHRD